MILLRGENNRTVLEGDIKIFLKNWNFLYRRVFLYFIMLGIDQVINIRYSRSQPKSISCKICKGAYQYFARRHVARRQEKKHLICLFLFTRGPIDS